VRSWHSYWKVSWPLPADRESLAFLSPWNYIYISTLIIYFMVSLSFRGALCSQFVCSLSILLAARCRLFLLWVALIFIAAYGRDRKRVINVCIRFLDLALVAGLILDHDIFDKTSSIVLFLNHMARFMFISRNNILLRDIWESFQCNDMTTYYNVDEVAFAT